MGVRLILVCLALWAQWGIVLCGTDHERTEAKQLGVTEEGAGAGVEEALQEIKHLQSLAEIERMKEANVEQEDAELLRGLEQQQEDAETGTIPKQAEQIPSGNKAARPQPAGLRYKKSPVEDDIISTRKNKAAHAAADTASTGAQPHAHASNGRSDGAADDAATAIPAVSNYQGTTDGVNGGSAPPAGELRRRMAAAGGNDKTTRRMTLEYAKQWQKEHGGGRTQTQTQEGTDTLGISDASHSSLPGDGDEIPFQDGEYASDSASFSSSYVNNDKDKYFFERYSIPRQWSRPVEAVLKHKHSLERLGGGIRGTLYDIMGVSPGSSISDIKKTFRQRSLKIHPDKNPHPDSKVAFDLLSDAYEVLSDEESRQIYDDRLTLARSVHSPFKVSNIKRRFSAFWDNFTSRILLFIARIRKGQWRDEVEDFTESIRDLPIWNVKNECVHLYKRFAFLPSWKDRMALLGEFIWIWKLEALVAFSAFLAFKFIFISSISKEVENYYYDNM